jgi:hypothetical protein
MAIAPGTRYPAQTDAAAGYPQGKARNAGSFQDGTGTPLEKDWVNDLWGFLQALLSNAGLAPSGAPDQVGASQYLAGVTFIAQQKADAAQAAATAAAIASAAATAATLASAAQALAEKRLALSNWSDQQQISASTVTSLSEVIWAPSFSLFLGNGGGTNRFCSSPDAFAFTVSASASSSAVKQMADNGAGVAMAAGGNQLRRTIDGLTWASATPGVASCDGMAWHASPGLFISCGSPGLLITSPDGVTWTARTSGVSDNLRAVASNGSIAVVVGDSGRIITSTNGTTGWTSRTSGTVQNLTDVTWNGALFCACGGTAVLTSPDGITWTTRVPGFLNTHQQANAAGDLLCLTGVDIGGTSTLIVSRDGATWKRIPPSTGMQGFVGAGAALPFAWSGSVGLVGGTSSGTTSYVRSHSSIQF